MRRNEQYASACVGSESSQDSQQTKNLISMSQLKVSGYNTHDCLTMLSLFLAIAIRVANHPYLKIVITCMCHFFNAISNKVIDVVKLDEICKEM
jgi:hypothetical protein